MNKGLKINRIHVKLTIAILLLLCLIARSGCFTSCRQNAKDRQVRISKVDTILEHSRHIDRLLSQPRKKVALQNSDGSPIVNKIIGVDDYDDCFPDMNDVQLATAQKLGINLIENREEAQRHKKSLVYIDDNPLYKVEHLSHSIPYLVPRAQRLLNEISLSFIDSLQRKGLPFYKLIITSVLRTKQDVTRLRRVNGNASENSCHQYGTTFDICYNSFYRVIDPDDTSKRQVWDGRLKEVLAEVLRDQRMMGTCYIRYEARQACFHITAR